LPFGREAVDEYPDPASAPQAPEGPTARADRRVLVWPASRTGRMVGWSTLGFGALAMGIAAGSTVAIARTKSAASPSEPQAATVHRNDRIGTYEAVAISSVAVGGAAVVTGAVLLLWPDQRPRTNGVSVVATPWSGMIGYGALF